jgi:hypothetical protein
MWCDSVGFAMLWRSIWGFEGIRLTRLGIILLRVNRRQRTVCHCCRKPLAAKEQRWRHTVRTNAVLLQKTKLQIDMQHNERTHQLQIRKPSRHAVSALSARRFLLWAEL